MNYKLKKKGKIFLFQTIIDYYMTRCSHSVDYVSSISLKLISDYSILY